MPSTLSTPGVTFIDGVGLHNAMYAYGKHQPVELSSEGLSEAIPDIRTRMGLEPESMAFAYMSLNFDSQRQCDVADRLEAAGIHLISFDYRQTAVHTSRMRTKTGERIPMNTSVVPYIAYALGMLSGKSATDVLVIGQSFELDYPMRAARKEGHNVVLAYWKPWLDRRFGRHSDIDFFDLENIPSVFEGEVRMFPNPDESPYEVDDVPVPVIPGQ